LSNYCTLWSCNEDQQPFNNVTLCRKESDVVAFTVPYPNRVVRPTSRLRPRNDRRFAGRVRPLDRAGRPSCVVRAAWCASVVLRTERGRTSHHHVRGHENSHRRRVQRRPRARGAERRIVQIGPVNVTTGTGPFARQTQRASRDSIGSIVVGSVFFSDGQRTTTRRGGDNEK